MLRPSLYVLAVFALATAACGSDPEQESQKSPPTSRSIPSPTTADEDSIYLCPEWEEGETRTYEITETKELRGVPGTGISEFAVEVVSATDSGYVFEWHTGLPTTIDLGEFSVDIPDSGIPGFEGTSELLGDLTLQVETDDCGFYTSIVNWEEIASSMNQVLRIYFEEARDSIEEPISDAELDLLLELMTTETAIETLVANDIILFYNPFGFPYYPDEPQAFDSLVPNPFGGEPLPASGYIALDPFDRQTGCGVITSDYSFDTEAAIEHLTDPIFEAFPSVSPSDLSEAPMITMTDHIEHHICQDDSWPSELSFGRTITVGNEERSDLTVMRDLGP